mgnify:CR=1 FL=1
MAAGEVGWAWLSKSQKVKPCASTRSTAVRSATACSTTRTTTANPSMLAPYGLTGDDIFDIFFVFMNVELHPDGDFTIKPCEAGPDDYIDLRAEMDILAAVSACPADTANVNRGPPGPLGIKILD